MAFERPLLILDLDETLIRSEDRPLDRPADHRVDTHFIYRRPFLSEFLEEAEQLYRLAVWSSAKPDYVQAIARVVRPGPKDFLFVWDRSNCIPKFDLRKQEEFYFKDIDKVAQAGFDLRQTLILENDPREVGRGCGNALFIKPYYGDESDQELPRLLTFLRQIRKQADFCNLSDDVREAAAQFRGE